MISNPSSNVISLDYVLQSSLMPLQGPYWIEAHDVLGGCSFGKVPLFCLLYKPLSSLTHYKK